MKPLRVILRTSIAAAATTSFGIGPLHAADLDEVFRLAQENDPTFLAASSAHTGALEGPVQARARLLPQVNATARYERSESSLRPPGEPYLGITTTSYDLTIEQPVYRRDLLVRLKQARSGVQKADVELALSTQELMLRAATRYFGVLRSADNLKFARANRQAIAEQLKQAQQRFDVGLIAITGVEEAKARFDLAKSDEIRAENTLSDALEELREITGEYFDSRDFARLGTAMPLTTPEPDDIEQWTRIAFEQNLQIASAGYDVAIARQGIRLAASGHYPSLTLVGAASGSDASKSALTTTGTAGPGIETQEFSLGLQLSVPIFTGWRVTSETRQARASYEQALNNYELARRTVQSTTRQSFNGVKSGIATVLALKQAVVSNKSALDAVQAGFQVGTRTSVDVLDAQQEFFKAEFDYSAARYDYILDTLNLKQAAGILSQTDLQAVSGWLEAAAKAATGKDQESARLTANGR